MSFAQTHRKGLLAGAGVLAGVILVYAVLCSVGKVGSYRIGDDSVATSTSGGADMGAYERGESGMGTAPAGMPLPPTMGRDGNAVYDEDRSWMPEEPTAGPNAAETDQRIIKNGFLNLTVDDVSGSSDKITAMATARKGFVAATSVSERADGRKEGYIAIRVPAAEFEAAMTEIKGLAEIVNNESATGQDVTEQFSDLQAQLRNAQAQETEYLRILKQATSVEDILQVQSYLSAVRGQIESLQGRLKYLENVTAYSTISVTLSEEAVVRVPTKEFRPVTIAKEALRALVVLGQDLVTAFIWLVIVGGGIAIPVALLVWLVLRALKARKQ